jgi:diguanylate cyclase (GGDEF)-like protein/PAS domain S-box-containing protein
MRALAGIAAAVDITWNDERLLRLVVDEILTVLGDRSTVQLTDAGGGAGPSATTHLDPTRMVLESTFVPDSAATAAATADATETVVSSVDASGTWLAELGLRQCATFPVTGGNRPVGLLAITRAAERPEFTGEDLAFGAAVAALLGVVVIDRRMLEHTTTAVEELRAQAEVVDQISDALIICDEHLRVLSWNAAAEKIYGYAQSEAIGCDLSALLTSQYFTVDGVPLKFDEVLTVVNEIGRWDGELHERHANGTSLVLLASISAANSPTGRHGDLVLINRDVTTQRREEHLATHDALTGLPNRRMLNARLQEVHARACRTGRSLALLFIDLDGFKSINDRYGHAAGDAVLTATAERLMNAVRRTDTVGRLGGDEFLVILEEVGTDENIRTVVDRVIDWVGRPVDIEGGSVTVHPSIGIAPARRPNADDQRPDQLLAAADHAMYLAKNRGGQAVFADTEPPGEPLRPADQ